MDFEDLFNLDTEPLFGLEAPTDFDFEPINFLYDTDVPSYVSSQDWGDLGSFSGGTTFSDMYPDLVSESKSGGVDWGNILGKAVETGVPALINSFSSNDSKSKDNPSPQANLDSAVKSLQNPKPTTPELKKEIFPVGNSVVVKPDRFIVPKAPASPGFNTVMSMAADGTLGGVYSASQKIPTDGEFGWQDAANIAAAYGQGKLTDMALMAVPGAGPALVAINKLHPEGLPGAFKDTGKFLGSAGNEIASGVGGFVDDVFDALNPFN